jgi:hypothetical protein
VAVKVTDWLTAEEGGDETRVVVVGDATTVMGDVVVVPVLALKLASEEYAAVMT